MLLLYHLLLIGNSLILTCTIFILAATGRPDDEDRKELQGFAEKVLAKIDGSPSDMSVPQIPGNHPYKKAGGAALVPKADHRCNACGLCAEKCPAQAINRDKPKETDGKKCISCMRCVAVCPQSARKVNSALVAVAAAAIKKACSEKKA